MLPSGSSESFFNFLRGGLSATGWKVESSKIGLTAVGGVSRTVSCKIVSGLDAAECCGIGKQSAYRETASLYALESISTHTNLRLSNVEATA
eukprot:4780697-Prymnesium_polylepis.1